MQTNQQETDRFLVGRTQQIRGEAHVQIRFDMATGREMLEDAFSIAARRELWTGTRMDFMRVYPRNNVQEIVVHRLPFGPHWPLATNTFVSAAKPDMEAIDATTSEALWHELRRSNLILEDGTPEPAFFLHPPQPLVIDGWSAGHCAYVRARMFAHMRPLAYAELTPEGSLKVAADRFVLTQISGGLRRGMGGRTLINTGERLRLLPDPRFCFDKGARDSRNQTVGQFDLIGFYTAPNEALDFLAQDIDSEADGFNGVIFDV